MADEQWPEEVVKLMQWCLDESVHVADRALDEWKADLDKADIAAISQAIMNGITNAYHRRSHGH